MMSKMMNKKVLTHQIIKLKAEKLSEHDGT